MSFFALVATVTSIITTFSIIRLIFQYRSNLKLEKKQKELQESLESTPDELALLMEKVKALCLKHKVPSYVQEKVLKSEPKQIVDYLNLLIQQYTIANMNNPLDQRKSIEREITEANLKKSELYRVYNQVVVPALEEERRLAEIARKEEERREEERAALAALASSSSWSSSSSSSTDSWSSSSSSSDSWSSSSSDSWSSSGSDWGGGGGDSSGGGASSDW